MGLVCAYTFRLRFLKATADRGDRGHYCFVPNSIQELCKACDIVPCILDASIFVSFDRGGWTEEIVQVL